MIERKNVNDSTVQATVFVKPLCLYFRPCSDLQPGWNSQILSGTATHATSANGKTPRETRFVA